MNSTRCTTAAQLGWDLSGRSAEPDVPDPQVTGTASEVPHVPRDPEQYAAAVASAGGDPVEELDAWAASANMTLFSYGSEPWFVVEDVTTLQGEETIYGKTKPTTIFEICHPGPGVSRWWVIDADRPVAEELTTGQWALLGATWRQVARKPEPTGDGWLRCWWDRNPRALYIQNGVCLTVAETDPRPQKIDVLNRNGDEAGTA